MRNKLKSQAIQVARELRKNQTKAEKLFWEAIRNKQLYGLKFRRQEPIFYNYYDQERFFICDFLCTKFKLIIEIDGGIHEKQKDYDNLRDEILSLKEYRVLRFKNEEIFKNLNGVLNNIKSYLEDELNKKIE